VQWPMIAVIECPTITVNQALKCSYPKALSYMLPRSRTQRDLPDSRPANPVTTYTPIETFPTRRQMLTLISSMLVWGNSVPEGHVKAYIEGTRSCEGNQIRSGTVFGGLVLIRRGTKVIGL
jgi:hypothetical protein